MEPRLGVDGRVHGQGVVDPDRPPLFLERGQDDLLVGGRHLELLDQLGAEPQTPAVLVPGRAAGPDPRCLHEPGRGRGRLQPPGHSGRQQDAGRGQDEAARLSQPPAAGRPERRRRFGIGGQLAGLVRVSPEEQPPEVIVRQPRPVQGVDFHGELPGVAREVPCVLVGLEQELQGRLEPEGKVHGGSDQRMPIAPSVGSGLACLTRPPWVRAPEPCRNVSGARTATGPQVPTAPEAGSPTYSRGFANLVSEPRVASGADTPAPCRSRSGPEKCHRFRKFFPEAGPTPTRHGREWPWIPLLPVIEIRSRRVSRNQKSICRDLL